MIARIDADHDAGLFRTQDFGIDCENFKKKCPENTPPKLLQCAFDCCGVISNQCFNQFKANLSIQVPYTTRPSFDSLCRVFESIIGDNDHLIAPIKKSDSSVPELSLKGLISISMK
jgi:hypothetical protein